MKELGPLKRNVNWSSAVKASVSIRYLRVAQHILHGLRSVCSVSFPLFYFSFLARGLLLFLSSSFNIIVKACGWFVYGNSSSQFFFLRTLISFKPTKERNKNEV